MPVLRRKLPKIELELSDPPKGVTLRDVSLAPGSLAFQLKASGEDVKPGLAGNLIVEAFTEFVPRSRQGKKPQKAQKKRRISLGVLPAIPFEIVRP